MKVLQNKSGVSLFFVLGAMMFLLALGASALTAAGVAFGAGFAQQERNQLELFVSSTERTLLALLENEAVTMGYDGDDLKIGSWIIQRVVEEFFAGVPDGSGGFITPPAINPQGYLRLPNTISEAVFFSVPSQGHNILLSDIEVTTPTDDGVLTQTLMIEGWVNIGGSDFVRRHVQNPYPGWPSGLPIPEPIPSTPLVITISTGILTARITTTYTPPSGQNMTTTTWITLELADPIILVEAMAGSVVFNTVLPSFTNMSIVELGQWEVILRGTYGS